MKAIKHTSVRLIYTEIKGHHYYLTFPETKSGKLRAYAAAAKWALMPGHPFGASALFKVCQVIREG